MSPRPERRTSRALHSLVAAGAGAVLLAACTTGPSEADPTATSAEPASTPTASTAGPTPTGGPSVLIPDGTAEDNLPLFTAVTAAVWASPEQVAGRAYIDALSAAGFDRGAMQVTYDESTVGNPAESIQFSVRWGEQCLVGQVGPATGAPVTVVVPALADGVCLVGATRPIDW